MRVRATNIGGNSADSPATTLTVENTPSTVSISGPSVAQRGASTAFTFNATDPSSSDQAQWVTFTIDWGDGSPIQTTLSNLALNVSLSHTYTTIGARIISVTATNYLDGSVSNVATTTVNVSSAKLTARAGLTDLVWIGTSGADAVQFDQIDSTTIRVITTLESGNSVNVIETFSGVTGWVWAKGAAGNDTLDASSLLTTHGELDGQDGNDTLYGGQAGNTLSGSIGNDTLYGGQGGDTLVGGFGNDVIIAGNGHNTIYGGYSSWDGGEGTSYDGDNLIVGGTGNDTINGAFGGADGGEGATESGRNLIIGNGGSDSLVSTALDGAESGVVKRGWTRGSILVGGRTSHSQGELMAVLDEWKSGRDYETRVANISGTGSGPRNNGDIFLQAGETVFNDSAVDQLHGNAIGEYNWYFYSVAVAQNGVTDDRDGEVLTVV